MTESRPVQVDLSPDKTSAWIHFSGLAYSDFGRTETLSHWALSRVFEATRYFGLAKGILEFSSLINRRTGYFVLGGLYHFDDVLWKVPRTTDFPYKVSLEITDIGKTSATLFSQMVNKLDNKILATTYIKLVFVDREMRRSIPLPEWIRERYTAAIKNRQPLSLPQSAPKIPDSAFCYTVTVTASDTDVNQHTNQGSYVRYCCDASQAAVQAGRLNAFAPDIAHFPLQTMQAVYVGESRFGDSLLLYLWQQDGQPDLLHFVIIREADSKSSPIFYAHMKYGLAPIKRSKL